MSEHILKLVGPAHIEQAAVSDYYIVDYTRIFEDTDPDYRYGDES